MSLIMSDGVSWGSVLGEDLNLEGICQNGARNGNLGKVNTSWLLITSLFLCKCLRKGYINRRTSGYRKPSSQNIPELVFMRWRMCCVVVYPDTPSVKVY